MNKNQILVSVIIPVHNGEKWIKSCFDSIISQDILTNSMLEVCVFNDGSTDNTATILNDLMDTISMPNLILNISGGTDNAPKGVGFAKNRAVENSCGEFLCFQDIDDIMEKTRISSQLECAVKHPKAIVGSCFRREPEGSTARFTRWANSLPPELLKVQIFTSHGPTVVMPTWFCSRQVFDRVGGFSEAGAGTPEDLIFFYKHLDLDGDVKRVDQQLLIYRFHPESTTLSISEETIWDLRISRLETKVLSHWAKFTIWNAGKQGKKLYRSLSIENRRKVECFCDVDVKKVGKYYEPYSPESRFDDIKIPVKHFTEAIPPFVVCVKLDLTGGQFEQNLKSLRCQEGVDYILFS